MNECLRQNMFQGTVHNIAAIMWLQYGIDWGVKALLHHADIRSVKNEREEHKNAACHSLVSISTANTLASKLLKVLETSK